MRTSCIGRGCRGERQETVSRGWRKRKPIEGLGERRIFASDDIVRLILDCTVGSGSRRPEATSLSVLITAGIRRYGKSVAGAAQKWAARAPPPSGRCWTTCWRVALPTRMLPIVSGALGLENGRGGAVARGASPTH